MDIPEEEFFYFVSSSRLPESLIIRGAEFIDKENLPHNWKLHIQ